MSCISQLSRKLRIDVQEEASSEEDIELLKNFAPIEVPIDYLEIVREATEIQICVDDSDYLRIWSANGVMELNRAYEIQKYLPKALALGDDDWGRAILWMPFAARLGIYLCGFGALDEEEALFVAPSLEDLLVKGIGIEVVTGPL